MNTFSIHLQEGVIKRRFPWETRLPVFPAVTRKFTAWNINKILRIALNDFKIYIFDLFVRYWELIL